MVVLACSTCQAEEELQQLSSSLKSEKARRAFHNRIAAFEHVGSDISKVSCSEFRVCSDDKDAKAELEKLLRSSEAT